jgi:hypothetical protein
MLDAGEDRDLALAVWHSGGTCEYVDMFEGTGAGFVDWVWEAHEGMLRHSHQITNVLMEVDVDGDRAVVMADVGRHCVIGAGSVVTRPIPDYAVAVGVPARVVRYRNQPQDI